MKKWLIIVGVILLALLVLAGSAWLWLTRSESGARWAVARAASAVERLEYADLSGGLASGLMLEGLDFEHAGSRVSADRLEIAARIELFAGPRLVVRHLRGRDIEVFLPEGEAAEPEAQTPLLDLASIASPIEVIIEEVDLRSLTVHAGGEPVLVDRIALTGRYGESVEIERLNIDGPDGRLSAQGQWALKTRGRGRVQVDAGTTLSDGSEQSLVANISGRLDSLDFELSSRGPAEVQGNARIRGLPESPQIETDLSGRIRDWPGLPLAIDDLVLRLEGRPGDWRARSSARLEGPDIPPGQWQLALSGGTQSLTIESLEADVLDGRISGSGGLDWSASAPASSASLRLESLDLTPLYPDWPNQGRVSGELTASTEGGVIEIESLALNASPGELSVTGSGRIDPGEDRIDAILEWRQFTWPPVSDDSEPLVASESGRLRLEGRISDWRARLEAVIDSPRSPTARVEARASGSAERAQIEQLNIDAGEAGSLSVHGSLAWAPGLSADLLVDVQGFDPGVLVVQLPGSINGSARLRLSRDEQLRAGVDVERLEGRLRGQSLVGAGRLAWLDDRPESAALDLRLGDNRITLDSPEAADWQFRLDAVALDQLWPDLEGRASLNGGFDPGSGTAELAGQVEQLRYRDYNLDEADIELALGWLEKPEVDLAVEARNLDLHPWDRIETLELTLAGGCADHRFELTAAGARGRIGLAAGGEWPDCLQGGADWRGELLRLNLYDTAAGDWQLTGALPVRVAGGSIRAQASCLAQGNGNPGRLCLDALEAGETGRVAARIEQVPMDLLLLPLNPVFSLTTPLSGRIEADWDRLGLARLGGSLRLDAGALRAIGEDEDLLSIESLNLDLEPGEHRSLALELQARLEGATELRGRARLADLRDPAATEIEGEARLDLPDIAAFAHLVPRVDRIGGAASGRVELAGSVTSPSISGQLAIQNGSLLYAPLGLDVRAIVIELAGSADRATLSGRAQSGDGQLRLNGEASLADGGWRLESRIDGERFAFAGAEWLALSASPALSLRAGPERVDVDGRVRIDRLRGGLPPGAAERVRPSPDVRVLGETNEDEAAVAAERRQVHGRVAIDLGDDASLATEGFQTELAGGIELAWNGPPRPQGSGTIRLPQGSYRAYGQNLEINDGEVIFSGQPIDNPRLDIRAVREIFGDPEVEAAGVHIAGSARNPEIQLYTDPPTSQGKALAYVVTGSDFDHAGGQGALNVGLYLLPNLFVSYGVGLFETGNVLSGRYEFSRRWGVRVVSGERDTGVDLSYTVNN